LKWFSPKISHEGNWSFVDKTVNQEEYPRMLRELACQFIYLVAGMNFEKEYKMIRRSNAQDFLEKIVLHAYRNVPYYREVFRKAGIVKNGILHSTDFEKIPILTKETLWKRGGDLVSRDYGTRKWYYNATSGSTGENVRFIQDRTFNKWVFVTTKYYYEDIINVKEAFAKKILLWFRPQNNLGTSFGVWTNRFNSTLRNQKFLDPRRLAEDTMADYIKIINSYKPEIIRGYPNVLYEICRYIEKRKIPIHSPKLVVSSAETLHDFMREKIEAILGAKVFDFYGSREVDGIAGECRRGLYHTFSFNNYIEVLDDNNRKVNEGENGKVIITTLHNYSMPLIRYEVGDMAILGPEKCMCGNHLQTLKNITGRTTSFFRREDGTLINGLFFTRILQEIEWIKQFRIIQEDYKKIRIIVVLKYKTLVKSEKREIEKIIRMVMGKDYDIDWDSVREIPRTRTGKYLHVQSLIST